MATELTDLDGVGPKTADRIDEAGYGSLSDLAEAEVADLAAEGISERKAHDLIKKAERNSIVIMSGDEVADELDERDHINTGVDHLDGAIGGGWEQDTIVGLYGSSGAGKTQMSFKAAVEAVQQTDKPVIYIETEPNRYSPERLQNLAEEEGVQEQIHRVEAHDLDDLENAYHAVEEAFNDLAMIIVDSFTAPFRLSDRFDGRESLSQRSAVMGRHLRKLQDLTSYFEAPILITAHIYGNPDSYGSPENIYGGSLMMHTASYFIYLKESGDLISANIENHPSQGESEVIINVTDNDLIGMKKKE